VGFVPGKSLEEAKMLVKGMRLLTPRDSIQDLRQEQQPQQQPPPQQHHHERLSDSLLVRRISSSDSSAPFLDFASKPAAPAAVQPVEYAPVQPKAPAPVRRVAWSDTLQSDLEHRDSNTVQQPAVAAAIGMMVEPASSSVEGADSALTRSLVVTDVVLYSPAAAAGIVAGDTITHIDGQSVTSGDQVAELVAGPEGSCLLIRGVRNGEPVAFSVIRRAMWLQPRTLHPTSTPLVSSALPSTSRSTSPPPPPPPPPLDTSSAVSALKASLHEACIAWQEDVRKLHRHYEVLLAPLCDHIEVHPSTAAVTSLHGCNDLSALADLLRVTRMAHAAACSPDDELIAKYVAMADSVAPQPQFAWSSISDSTYGLSQLDPSSQDVQRALKAMNQKLFTTQHQCLMLEKKCEAIPELQAALESSRAEVHRLDDCIAKFRSAVRCRAYC
jgi:hypothetical protein